MAHFLELGNISSELDYRSLLFYCGFSCLCSVVCIPWGLSDPILYMGLIRNDEASSQDNFSTWSFDEVVI